MAKKNRREEHCEPQEQHTCHCSHMDVRFETIESRLESMASAMVEAGKEYKKLKEVIKMAMQDVKDAVDVINGKFDALKTSVDALIAQGPVSEDTSEVEAALGTLGTGMDDLKAAVDAKLTPPTPPQP